jgi:hypothetical protein
MDKRGDSMGAATSRAALALWEKLAAQFALDLESPSAGPTPDHTFLMVWDRGKHHFEIEVLASGDYEWMYRDRVTEYFTGGDVNALEDFPANMLDRARIVAGG